MPERLPQNLQLLYSEFGRKAIGDILPGDSFMVDDVEFVCKYVPESTSRRFFIVKELPLIARYRELCETEWKHGRIVELGIAEGGSTALMALLAAPEKLIAVDIESEPLAALASFIEERQLQESVRPYYGVDDECAGEPLDVVIDDASHAYFLTKASFETLFPRLRPGGAFLIEDWNAAHLMRAAFSDTSAANYEDRMAELREGMARTRALPESERPPAVVPLSRLAVECLLLAAKGDAAVESVTVDKEWITVRRGHAPLDPDSFRLDDVVADYFGNLPALG